MKVYLIRHAKTQDAEDQLTQRHVTPIVVNTETLDKVEKVKNRIGNVIWYPNYMYFKIGFHMRP